MCAVLLQLGLDFTPSTAWAMIGIKLDTTLLDTLLANPASEPKSFRDYRETNCLGIVRSLNMLRI